MSLFWLHHACGMGSATLSAGFSSEPKKVEVRACYYCLVNVVSLWVDIYCSLHV